MNGDNIQPSINPITGQPNVPTVKEEDKKKNLMDILIDMLKEKDKGKRNQLVEAGELG
jgi:hypothetical protein